MFYGVIRIALLSLKYCYWHPPVSAIQSIGEIEDLRFAASADGGHSH